ncbi:MAG: FosX/FosE/FosI family fosfomycin resistance hydrolase [Armatimonadota bacterium]
MIECISHVTFIVKNLDLAQAFFTSIFDAKVIYSSGDSTFSLSKERFLLIGDLWIAIMEGESILDRTYNHLAFKICEDDFDSYESRVIAMNIEIIPPRPRTTGEGRSLYFYDFDNHLFELHTGTLPERLARYTDRPEIT